MTVIERAATALCELDGNPPGATMDGKPLWQDYIPEVRAVLLAIREPSPGMVAEAVSEYVGDVDAENVWQAMVDELLSEHQESKG